MSQFSPFMALLSNAGAPITRLLESAMLPRSVRDEPVRFAAARNTFDFVRRAVDSQGIPDLSWRAAEEGSSWRRIVDDLHREAVLPMLNDPALSIREIALALGY
jgi:hypothetical protein